MRLNNRSKSDDQGKALVISAVITIVTLSFVGVLILKSFAKPTYTFSGNELTISGLYHVTIDLTDAAVSHELSRIPTLELRTNGSSIGAIKKGYYRLDGAKVYLNIMDDSAEDYILITDQNGDQYYVNCKTTGETDDLYDEILSQIGSVQ